MPDIVRPTPQTSIPNVNNYAYSPPKNNANTQYNYNSSNGGGINLTNATNVLNGVSESVNGASTSILGSSLGGAVSGASVGTLITPGIGTGIGALIGAVGGLFGSLAQRMRQKKQQKYNEQQVEKQNQFNAEQAELANQRTRENMELANQLQNSTYDSYYSYGAQVRQMKNAGLNPASMYNQGTQGVGGSASSPSSPSASSSALASTPLASDAEMQGALTNQAHLQLDALSVGANNTRTLADATRISIDNATANQRNISEILKNYAEIERLHKAGMLDETTAHKISTMLSAELENVQTNTRLTSITADNTSEVMQSTALNNKASATNNYSSANLNKQKTETEKFGTDLEKYKSFRENLNFQDMRDQFTICNDICDRYGIDRRYRQNIRDLIQNVAQKSGVDLINIGAKTLFSWLDFANWKSIFVANKFTKSSEKIAEQQLQKIQELASGSCGIQHGGWSCRAHS